MGVKVSGLERSRLIPQHFERARREFMEAVTPTLVEDFIAQVPHGSHWPKGRRKKLHQQVRGFIKGNRIIVGTFHSRFARALDTGLTVEPRKRKVIRFRNEEGVFVFTRKPITHRPRPYFGRILARVPAIVTLAYDRAFSRVGR